MLSSRLEILSEVMIVSVTLEQFSVTIEYERKRVDTK